MKIKVGDTGNYLCSQKDKIRLWTPNKPWNLRISLDSSYTVGLNNERVRCLNAPIGRARQDTF